MVTKRNTLEQTRLRILSYHHIFCVKIKAKLIKWQRLPRILVNLFKCSNDRHGRQQNNNVYLILIMVLWVVIIDQLQSSYSTHNLQQWWRAVISTLIMSSVQMHQMERGKQENSNDNYIKKQIFKNRVKLNQFVRLKAKSLIQ